MNLLPFALLPGLTAAICAAHDAIQDGVEFLRAHMPAQDRGTVTQERLVREVRLALAARSQFPWAAQVPWELYENNVLPYAVVNEPRDEWREQFHHLFAPLVSPCKTGREAALAIASLIQKTLNVRYSTERRVPHQGVKESLPIRQGLLYGPKHPANLRSSLRGHSGPHGGRSYLEPRARQPQLGGSLV